MSRFNPEKKLKSWESKYPINKPRDLKFHITLEVPERDGVADTVEWERLKVERRAWLNASRIRFQYMKKILEKTIDIETESEPGFIPGKLATISSGKSLFSFMYSTYGLILDSRTWPNKWQDVYSFETEEIAVAFKLVFG